MTKPAGDHTVTSYLALDEAADAIAFTDDRRELGQISD